MRLGPTQLGTKLSKNLLTRGNIMWNNLQTIDIGTTNTLQLSFDELFPDTFAERKRVFLNNLSSPSGKMKYKRYIGAPIRYAGGKSLAVGLVIELMPNDVKRVVSPFLGGGSVEVAIAKELCIVEVCDVCGKPLKRGQKLGKKKSNNALCHNECLYYKKSVTI